MCGSNFLRNPARSGFFFKTRSQKLGPNIFLKPGIPKLLKISSYFNHRQFFSWLKLCPDLIPSDFERSLKYFSKEYPHVEKNDRMTTLLQVRHSNALIVTEWSRLLGSVRHPRLSLKDPSEIKRNFKTRGCFRSENFRTSCDKCVTLR